MRVTREVSGKKGHPAGDRRVVAVVSHLSGPGEPAVAGGRIVEVRELPDAQVDGNHCRFGVPSLNVVRGKRMLGVFSCTPRFAYPPASPRQTPARVGGLVASEKRSVRLARCLPLPRIRKGGGPVQARRNQHAVILARGRRRE